jgi:hypothetical protein
MTTTTRKTDVSKAALLKNLSDRLNELAIAHSQGEIDAREYVEARGQIQRNEQILMAKDF